LSPSTGTLHLRGNVLTRVALSKELIARLAAAQPGGPQVRIQGLFWHAFATENVVREIGNCLLTVDLVLTANEFYSIGNDVGSTISRSVIYTSNHAPDDVRLFSVARTRALAGNLTINIVPI
jgi:hypothetical protein